MEFVPTAQLLIRTGKKTFSAIFMYINLAVTRFLSNNKSRRALYKLFSKYQYVSKKYFCSFSFSHNLIAYIIYSLIKGVNLLCLPTTLRI